MLRDQRLSGWRALATIGLTAAACAAAQQPQTRLISRDALAVDQTTHALYAVDPPHDQVYRVDTRTGVAQTIAVGHEPVGLAVDERRGRVYVVNSGSGAVSVIDEARRMVIATVRTDAHPYAIALDPALGLGYVSNTFSNLLTVMDLRADTSVQRPLGSQDFLSVDPVRHRLVMFGYEGAGVKVMDERTRAITTLDAAPHHWGLAIAPATGVIYVPEIGNGTLAVEGRAPVPVGAMPDAVAVDAKRERVFVADYSGSAVTVLDMESLRRLATIPVGQRPQALLADSRRGLVYVANAHSNSVSVIDEVTNRVRATVASGPTPYALAFDNTSGSVYAATYGAIPYARVVAGPATHGKERHP